MALAALRHAGLLRHAAKPPREFVSGGRISDWRENKARHKQIRDEFFRWQSAKVNAEKLAQEYLAAKQRVKPGVGDKNFDKFREARKKLQDFVDELDLNDLKVEAGRFGKNWEKFQRLFEDDPGSEALRVFADETSNRLSGRPRAKPLNVKGGDNAEERRADEVVNEHREAHLRSYPTSREAVAEFERVTDNIIEYLEKHNLEDPDNWVAFADNFQGRSWSYSFSYLAAVAATYFDMPNPSELAFKSGPVKINVPESATEEEVRQFENYAAGSNRAIAANALSRSGRVPTGQNGVRSEAEKAATKERKRARLAGAPYKGVAGHVPDATWMGQGEPYEWQDMSKKVNSSLAGQVLRYPEGYKPTRFEVEYPDRD